MCHVNRAISVFLCCWQASQTQGGAQVDEERDQQLSQLRADMTERLTLNRQRLEEEHANLLEAQAQVSHVQSGFLHRAAVSKHK